jgi:prophage regulatory protein
MGSSSDRNMSLGMLPFLGLSTSEKGPVLASRSVASDELAGVSEIAEMLGVTRRTAARYVDRTDFPEPTETLSRGRVWLRADIEAWAREHLPLPSGRPRKHAD